MPVIKLLLLVSSPKGKHMGIVRHKVEKNLWTHKKPPTRVLLTDRNLQEMREGRVEVDPRRKLKEPEGLSLERRSPG